MTQVPTGPFDCVWGTDCGGRRGSRGRPGGRREIRWSAPGARVRALQLLSRGQILEDSRDRADRIYSVGERSRGQLNVGRAAEGATKAFYLISSQGDSMKHDHSLMTDKERGSERAGDSVAHRKRQS